MIPLLDASPGAIPNIAAKLGVISYGQLLTPLTNYRIHDGLFAIDNGGFSRQDPDALNRLVQKARPSIEQCQFIVMPDVPGNALRTAELFAEFAELYKDLPLALACQNGIESMEIPWAKIDALFIAGKGDWSVSGDIARHLISAAKWRKKWVHVGRVSTLDKWKFFEALGADSCDSSVLVRNYGDRNAALSQYLKGRRDEESTIDDCNLFDLDDGGDSRGECSGF